ncbi:protein of unknown function [Streptomyces sp. KY70]|nr:protein of unknown function [Streptomyces sp. KY70]
MPAVGYRKRFLKYAVQGRFTAPTGSMGLRGPPVRVRRGFRPGVDVGPGRYGRIPATAAGVHPIGEPG